MKLRRWLFRAGVAAAVLALSMAPAWAARTLSVYVGESTTLQLGYQFSKVAVGDPSIADYSVQRNTPTGAELLLNGKQAGSTNLIIWDMEGKVKEELVINSLVRDVKALLSQLQALIGPTEGLRYRIAGGKLILEGEVITLKDKERINKVVKDSPQVLNLTSLSPLSLKVIAESIQAEIGDPTIKARGVGQQIALEGVVFNDDAKKRVEGKAKLFFPDIANLLEVRKAKLAPGKGEMIQVTAHFMEVKNSTIDGWGISWLPGSTSSATGTQAIGTAEGFVGSITGTITNLFPKISSAKESGGARVLETSSMSVRSGDDATFHSGGEQAIPISQSSGAISVDYKAFGVFLKVLPIISPGDKISLQLEVEVSAVNSYTAGYPNFTKSKVSTVQYCKSGDSVAVGGLVSNRHTKLFDKLPDGATDALFQLYASEDFRRQQSQFVVFVTAAVLKTGAKEGHQEMKGIVEDSFGAYQEEKR
jgi:pilus assembly protein CpaC